MATNYGPPLVLAAGAITFGNEWMQTGNVNWRVPIATLLGAGAIGVIGMASASAGTTLGVMVFIAAATIRSNGKSAIDELSSNLPHH